MERSRFITTYIKKIVQICISSYFFVMHNHKIVSCIWRDTNWEWQEVCLWKVDGKNMDRIHIGGWRLTHSLFNDHRPQRNIFINSIIEFLNLTMEHNPDFGCISSNGNVISICGYDLYNLHINCYYYYERIVRMIY